LTVLESFRYSVHMITYESAGHDTLDPNVAEKIIANLRNLGFSGIEPIGIPEKMQQVIRLEELLSSYSLNVPMIAGLWGRLGTLVTFPNKDPTSSDLKRQEDAVEYIRLCCDIAVKLNSPYVQTTLAPSENDQSQSGIRRARANLIEVLKKSALIAKDRGVCLMFEPQCRFEGYYGVNNTVGSSLNILEETGAENIALMVDTFHANIEEVSIPMAIIEAKAKLHHIHAADNNRLPPGMGSLDFKPILRELVVMKYEGYIGLECFPIGSDPDLLLEKGFTYLKAVESAVRS